MTKPTQATIFRKRQILPARALNKAIQEYGSVDGVIPYKENGAQDTSMSAPLGTKTAPFGDAYFRGLNLYTQLEVQQLAESGQLTDKDRMVFWNLDTNTLSAWDGAQIISLGGNGGGGMDYLFGTGNDGDVTMVADGAYDTVKNFTNFTLNAGVTLTKGTAGSPLIIKCTGTCTLNGTINLDGKGFVGRPDAAGLGYSGIAGISGTNVASSGSFDANLTTMLASLLHFDSIALMGGAGAGAYAHHGSSNVYRAYIGGKGAASGGDSRASASGSQSSGNVLNLTGGSGGGGILVLARKIIINATISGKGLNGEYRSSNGASAVSGGGGGGAAVFVAKEIENNGTYSFTGGASGHGDIGYGGTGGYVTVII